MHPGETLHISGWLRPYDSSQNIGSISLRVVGWIGAGEALVDVVIPDATSHGCPYDIDLQLRSRFGTWLTLAGLLRSTKPRFHRHLGEIELSSVSIFERTDAEPKGHTESYTPLTAITARFPDKPLTSAHRSPAPSRSLWEWQLTERALIDPSLTPTLTRPAMLPRDHAAEPLG